MRFRFFMFLVLLNVVLTVVFSLNIKDIFVVAIICIFSGLLSSFLIVTGYEASDAPEE